MKHERAAIVGLAYVIGFVTAFIGFGLTGTDSVDDIVIATPKVIRQTASVGAAFKNDQGLYAVVDNESLIISARSEAQTEPGFHYDVLAIEVSPDKKFVHFCEQNLAVPTVCTHYVYAADQHVIEKVVFNNEPLISDISTADASWNEEGQLQIRDLISVSAGGTWNME